MFITKKIKNKENTKTLFTLHKWKTVLVVAMILSACGGDSGDLEMPEEALNDSSYRIRGTVPGTVIEAFCSNGSYFKVLSEFNGTGEHPFELALPTQESCRIVMTTNEDNPSAKIVTSLAFSSDDGQVGYAISGVGSDIDIAHVALPISRSEMVNDINGDGVEDIPWVVPLNQNASSHVVIDNPINESLDHDNDGIINVYEDTDSDGIANHQDTDDDNDGVPDYDDLDDNNDGVPDNDFDNDGVTNGADIDDDNDGRVDAVDPDDDNDELMDVVDDDDDNDGILDLSDEDQIGDQNFNGIRDIFEIANTIDPATTESSGNNNELESASPCASCDESTIPASPPVLSEVIAEQDTVVPENPISTSVDEPTNVDEETTEPSEVSTPVVTAAPVPAPPPTQANTIGNIGPADLVSLHFDNAPDRDDGHALVANKVLSDHFGVTRLHVVNGTHGYKIRDRFQTASEPLFDKTWPQGLNAYRNWSQSVKTTASVWSATVSNGGSVWVAEGGPLDFTADVLRAMPSEQRKKVIVVQHSHGWNEDNSKPANVSFVDREARYVRIDDGNKPNKTADLHGPSDQFVRKALSSRWSDLWRAAFNYLKPSKKLDFSDTVEYLWILGVPKSQVSNATEFANVYF